MARLWFCATKTFSMKKTIFVLPLCLFLAFCSSSRKVTTPAGPGISNVNVSRGDSMVSAQQAGASFTTADRDWAYKANHDTILNGTWKLEGIMASNGTWSSMQSTDSAMTMTDTAMSMMMDNGEAGMSAKTKTKSKSKAKRSALYDTARARLNLTYKDTMALDTAVQPFAYWKRNPTLIMNGAKQVFYGNTGCNSMSGTFNFSAKDIQFGRNIITSKMACNDYDELTFLSALQKADNYTLNGDTLEIRQGNTLLLTFKRS